VVCVCGVCVWCVCVVCVCGVCVCVCVCVYVCNYMHFESIFTNSTTSYTSLCTCTFSKVFVPKYLGGIHMCTINILKNNTSRPHTSKDWTEFSFCLSLSSLAFSLAICEASISLLLFHHKDIVPFRHFFITYMVVANHMPCLPPMHVFILSIAFTSSDFCETSIESIFLSRIKRYIVFVLRNRTIL